MLPRPPKRPILLLLVVTLAIVLFSTFIQTQGTSASSPSRGASSRMAGRLVASPPPVDFQLAGNYDAGYRPRQLVKGDFNSDGKLDLAVPNWYGYTISILLGTATGAFPTTTTYSDQGNPFSMAGGDLNGDSKLDLVTANPADGTVNILLGNGTGAFQFAAAYSAGVYPEWVTLGDLNHDSVLDIVAANSSSGTVSVFLGTGTGSFQSAASYVAGYTPNFATLGDLNNDGALDIAVTNYTNSSVGILLGNGNGTFSYVTNYPVGVNPRFIAIGDINSDGKPDLATANLSSNSASVLLGNGDSTFLAASNITVGSGPNSVTFGDLNDDNHLDLVVTNGGANNIGVLLGNGDGSFQSQKTYSTGSDPGDVAIADLNGDGKPDLAVMNFFSNSVSILLNQDSTPTTPTPIATATPLPSPTATSTSTVPPIADRLTINGGALTTTSINVNLDVSAANATGGQVGLNMSFSNNGVDWSSWQPYADSTLWQLTNGDGLKTVYGRFKDSAGNLSAIVSDTITLDTSVQSEYGVTINDGALYTNQVTVQLKISAKPRTVAMQISNDGGFYGLAWEPYTSHKTWQITHYGDYAIPRIVYVRYRDTTDNVSATYQDDIILDMERPHGDVHITNTNQGAVLHLDATDNLSGVGSMRLSAQSDFTGANWEPFTASRAWNFGNSSTVYVQFRDNAGNISQTYATSRDGPRLIFLPLVVR